MFEGRTMDRWRPTGSLIIVATAVGGVLLALATAVRAIRDPIYLGYTVTRMRAVGWWRVTGLWPSSVALARGVRVGLRQFSLTRPPTQGQALLLAGWGRYCRRIVVLPGAEYLPALHVL